MTPVLHVSQRYPGRAPVRRAGAAAGAPSADRQPRDRVRPGQRTRAAAGAGCRRRSPTVCTRRPPTCPQGEARIALKEVHLNRCPCARRVDPPARRRLRAPAHRSGASHRSARARLRDAGPALAEKVRRGLRERSRRARRRDVDAGLYEGFVGDGDKRRLADVRAHAAGCTGHARIRLQRPAPAPSCCSAIARATGPTRLTPTNASAGTITVGGACSRESGLSETASTRFRTNSAQLRAAACRRRRRLALLDQLDAWGANSNSLQHMTTYFSDKTFRFLRALARNNERAWFLAHKADYEAHVRGAVPATAARTCSRRWREVSQHFRADPKPVGGSLFRIHRDTRFANDKTPYKRWQGARLFHARGRQVAAPSFYIHLEPGECFVGAGLWHPEPPTQRRVRQFIFDNPGSWKAAAHAPAFRRALRPGTREKLVRPPRGFPAGLPNSSTTSSIATSSPSARSTTTHDRAAAAADAREGPAGPGAVRRLPVRRTGPGVLQPFPRPIHSRHPATAWAENRRGSRYRVARLAISRTSPPALISPCVPSALPCATTMRRHWPNMSTSPHCVAASRRNSRIGWYDTCRWRHAGQRVRCLGTFDRRSRDRSAPSTPWSTPLGYQARSCRAASSHPDSRATSLRSIRWRAGADAGCRLSLRVTVAIHRYASHAGRHHPS